jgi:hypothetical protein
MVAVFDELGFGLQSSISQEKIDQDGSSLP